MKEKTSTFHFNLSTVDHIGVGFFKYALSPRDRFIIINNYLTKMLGYSSKAELKSKSLFSFFVYPQQKHNFLRLIEEKGKVSFFETLFRRKDGEKIWVAIMASCINQTASKTYIEGIIEDITSHKEMEERLTLERSVLQSLLDNIPDAIYFKDRKNRIIKINKFYTKGVNLKPEEIIGKTDFDFFLLSRQERCLKMIIMF